MLFGKYSNFEKMIIIGHKTGFSVLNQLIKRNRRLSNGIIDLRGRLRNYK